MSHSPEFLVLSEKLLPDINFSPKAHHKAEFIQQTSPYISHLLETDFQKLVQIMYRIDVSEKEFALTLQPVNNNDVTKSLAELIYDRLLLKAQYRAKYKEN